MSKSLVGKGVILVNQTLCSQPRRHLETLQRKKRKKSSLSLRFHFFQTLTFVEWWSQQSWPLINSVSSLHPFQSRGPATLTWFNTTVEDFRQISVSLIPKLLLLLLHCRCHVTSLQRVQVELIASSRQHRQTTGSEAVLVIMQQR